MYTAEEARWRLGCRWCPRRWAGWRVARHASRSLGASSSRFATRVWSWTSSTRAPVRPSISLPARRWLLRVLDDAGHDMFDKLPSQRPWTPTCTAMIPSLARSSATTPSSARDGARRRACRRHPEVLDWSVRQPHPGGRQLAVSHCYCRHKASTWARHVTSPRRSACRSTAG